MSLHGQPVHTLGRKFKFEAFISIVSVHQLPAVRVTSVLSFYHEYGHFVGHTCRRESKWPTGQTRKVVWAKAISRVINNNHITQ